MDEVKRLLEEAKQRYNNAKKALQEINTKFDGLYDESIKAVTVEELDAVKGKMEILKQQKTMAQERVNDNEVEVNRLEKELTEKSKAVLPASMPSYAPVDGTLVNVPQPEQNDANKAVYQLRYGDYDPATKSVIKDLYGASYEDDRNEQIKAFNLYMRGKDRLISAKGLDLLHQVILTPEWIKEAIKNGADVAFLKSTMVEAIDTLGGITVPVDYQTRIIERKPGMVVMRGRAQQMNTSRDRVQLPTATGGDSQYVDGVRITWVDETPSAASVSETNSTFGLKDIAVHTAMATVPMSKNLLEDSAFNLSTYIIDKFSKAKTIAEDNAFLVGNGSGKPQGVLPGGTGLAAGLASVVTGDASAMTFNGVLRAIFGIDSQYKDGSVWIANKDTYLALSMLQDGTGNYLWTEMRGNNAAGLPGTLRGYKTLEQEIMPDIAANAYPILFGNPEGYQIVDRLGMTVQRYDTQAGTNTITYEMKFRIGGQLTMPWTLVAVKVAAS
jgi:HK97 family phage major capsid protein